MHSFQLSTDNLAKLAETYNPTKPIYMLNLWRYAPTATYAPEHAHLSPSPCTGEEALKRYRAAIQAVIPPKCAVHFTAKPLTNVVAPEGEHWDAIVLVKYQDLQGFRDMAESKKYREEVEPHRLAGLADMRLICSEVLE
ncbi:hypothetical protein EK21DRAFT_85517 [Setomelanomma holmii]|uniref:DUF1330 domain-containing protein n=1 Tax=Setomelanomma holmii TaxID=210430 RepID=A0A9P4HHE1_9PLEO|nr:hypothetical protein EK21DRAFT_85517 [Setomelanomma holmii]